LRRILYTLVASAMLVAVIPATALAHGRSHHRRHHQHFRVHHKQFGQPNAPVTGTSADNAGTVMSFDGTTLTIKLNNGNMVSGAVTPDTEIECAMANNDNNDNDVNDDVAFRKDDHGGGSGSGDNGDHGDRGDNRGDDNRGDDNDNDDNAMENCSTANLTTGTVVHEAELRLDGAGATWHKIELVS
jgi:hypothetical protein